MLDQFLQGVGMAIRIDTFVLMTLGLFGGMLVELITLFVVPVLFSLMMEFKMQSGLKDEYWQAHNTDTVDTVS